MSVGHRVDSDTSMSGYAWGVKVYMVTEMRVDHDGWQVGSKRILYVTANKRRAERDAEPYLYGSRAGIKIDFEELTVEDMVGAAMVPAGPSDDSTGDVDVPRADLAVLLGYAAGWCHRPAGVEAARLRLMAAIQDADQAAAERAAWNRLCGREHHRGVECATAVCRWNLP